MLLQNPEGKRIISFNSRVYNKEEQKCQQELESFAVLYQLCKHTNTIY